MSAEDMVTEIKGTVTLKDGTVSEFSIQAGYGWFQWGERSNRLSRTVPLMDALEQASLEFLYDAEDPTQNEELDLTPGTTMTYEPQDPDADDPDRSGELVEVLRQVTEGVPDPDRGAEYEVRFNDDTTGRAFRKELT